jgi:hypothetical protein
MLEFISLSTSEKLVLLALNLRSASPLLEQFCAPLTIDEDKLEFIELLKLEEPTYPLEVILVFVDDEFMETLSLWTRIDPPPLGPPPTAVIDPPAIDEEFVGVETPELPLLYDELMPLPFTVLPDEDGISLTA